MALRCLLVAALAVACSAFAPATPALQLSKVATTRVADLSMMARAPPKKAAKAAKEAAPKKAAPAPKPVAKKAPVKKAVVKKSVGSGKSPVGKGGIFPWITNEPGTYGKPLMLSSIDFTSDAGDAWIGWGFMPQSVKKTLYPKGYKGMFGK